MSLEVLLQILKQPSPVWLAAVCFGAGAWMGVIGIRLGFFELLELLRA
jgi:hypothetical protein